LAAGVREVQSFAALADGEIPNEMNAISSKNERAALILFVMRNSGL
jgi:hypothetical protein